MFCNVLIFCVTLGIIFSTNITDVNAATNCKLTYIVGESLTSWAATLRYGIKEFVVVCDEVEKEKLTQALVERSGTWILFSQDPSNPISWFPETIYDPVVIKSPVKCSQGYSLTLQYNVEIPIATSTGRQIKGLPSQIQGNDITPYLTSCSNLVFKGDAESINAFVGVLKNAAEFNGSISYPGWKLPYTIQSPILGNIILDDNNAPTGMASVIMSLPLQIHLALENEFVFYDGVAFLFENKIKLFVTPDEKKHIVDFLRNNNSWYGILWEQNVFVDKSFSVDIKASCEQTDDTAALPTTDEGKQVLILVIDDIEIITAG